MVQGGLAKRGVWHPLACGFMALGLTDSFWIMKPIFDIQLYLILFGTMPWCGPGGCGQSVKVTSFILRFKVKITLFEGFYKN